MKTVIALVALLVAGCATQKGYEEILNTWINQPESDLVASWGAPDATYEAGGDKFLTYSNSRSGYVPAVQPNYQTTVIGNTAYTNAIGGVPGHSYMISCKTTFRVRNGAVRSWSHEGNGCRA